MVIIQLILTFLKAFFADRAALVAENLAFRHQPAVLRRSVHRPKFCRRNRMFWSWLSRPWTGSESALLIVQPGIVGGGQTAAGVDAVGGPAASGNDGIVGQ